MASALRHGQSGVGEYIEYVYSILYGLHVYQLRRLRRFDARALVEPCSMTARSDELTLLAAICIPRFYLMVFRHSTETRIGRRGLVADVFPLDCQDSEGAVEISVKTRELGINPGIQMKQDKMHSRGWGLEEPRQAGEGWGLSYNPISFVA